MRLISVDDCSFDFLSSVFRFFKSRSFGSRGFSILPFFLENSTRTLVSFTEAASLCSSRIIDFNLSTSSLSKGETDIETLKTCGMYSPNCVIFRTPNSGQTALLAQYLPHNVHVINAGDGSNEHPTQAIGDLFTICDAYGITDLSKSCLSGLEIAICGDVLNSRVARSNIKLLSKYGAKVHLVAPPCFLPQALSDYYKLTYGCIAHDDINECFEFSDVVMLLRIQKERAVSSGFQISKYSIKQHNIHKMKDKSFIMHPGPFNDGAEITQDIAYNNKKSLILKQVESGLYTRAGILSAL